MFGLRDRIRAYLGVESLPRLENTMTTMLELLTGLTAKTDEASAAQQASFLNLHNAVTRLEQNVRALQEQVANGDASPAVQELAGKLAENLATMKKAAETADDGFEPVEAPTEPTTPVDPSAPVDPTAPVEPTPETPAEPTVPGDDTPTVPVEDVPADPGTQAKRSR